MTDLGRVIAVHQVKESGSGGVAGHKFRMASISTVWKTLSGVRSVSTWSYEAGTLLVPLCSGDAKHVRS